MLEKKKMLLCEKDIVFSEQNIIDNVTANLFRDYNKSIRIKNQKESSAPPKKPA
jgi:hypothetical protein